jgi:RNA-directed DNA polymerase
MNAVVTACASSDRTRAWHRIDWAACHQNVRRLQARIVKATEAGRWGKVHALQWLLTHSWSGKALAVKRVTENTGKNTPGVDKVLWSTPEAKAAGVLSLQRRGYTPQPLRRVYIPKSHGRQRPLGIPTMKDRAMQALHLLALDPVSETTADPNSYGFRQGRSAHDALEQCFKVLGKPTRSPEWILNADIKGCFDNICHDWMLRHLPMDTAVLRKWLQAGVVENHKLYPTEQGTPQGGIISPTAANMVLDGLERMLSHAFRKRKSGGQVINSKVHCIRYADDFVVTGTSPDVLIKAKGYIEAFLAERGLTLSPEKTTIVHITEGFEFLGQHVRRYGDKILIKPSKKAVQRVYRRIKDIVWANKAARQQNLIGLLNPIITGWVNYHCHAVASVTFHRLDYLVWHVLWQWAVRRHRNKGRQWIRRKYFRTVGTRTWTFACDRTRRKGDVPPKLMSLAYAGDTKIRRHVKVQAALNPYSPRWEAYMEKRLTLQMANSLRGKGRIFSLWKSQDGRCPACKEPLTCDTGWHVHHVIYRAKGGSDHRDNLRLLHPNCHRQLHVTDR